LPLRRILDSKGIVRVHRVEALSQVLDLPQLVIVHSVMILYVLLHYHGLGVGLVVPLMMNRFGHSINEFLLSKAESMALWFNLTPGIVSLLLLASRNRAMREGILVCIFLGLLHSAPLGVE
jgi:hypothetical protein